MFAWRDNFMGYSAATGDPYWTSVSLLQNFEYPSIPSAYDLSTNNFQLSVTGTARPSTRTPFSTGNSYKFDGSTASQITIPQSTVFNAASNNFTVECWVYITSFPANNLEFVAIATNAATVGQATARIVSTAAGAVYFLCNNATNGWIFTGTTIAGTLTTNTWYHLAGVRNGSSFVLYVNGVSKLSYTYSGVVGYLSAGNLTHIGNLPVGMGFTGPNNCWITNVRWVNGTAVYTAAFTPPTSPLTAITNTGLLLTFPNTNQSNNSVPVDYSYNSYPVVNNTNTGTVYASPFTNNPGSYSFVTGYFTAVTQTGFNYGSGAFTVEGWFYFTTTGVIQYLIDQRDSTSAAITPTIYVNASNNLIYFSNGSDRITGTTSITTGQWYHVAVCKSGTSTKLFLNGTQEGSTYSDSNTYIQSRMAIGTNSGSPNSNNFVGYVSNVRLSKGFAYYTTTFTPSTTPLTTDIYTSLLVSGTYSGVYDLSNNKQNIYNISFTGSLSSTSGGTTSTALTSAVQYKWGSQGGYFQRQNTSVSGYEIVLDSTTLRFGTGDFTIEGWFYCTTTSITSTIMSKGASFPTGWLLQINSSNQLIWVSGSTTLRTSTTTISANTWTYFAITRSGTTGYMFINGTLEGASYTDNTNYAQTNNLFLGCDRSNANGFVGYLDDIRITTGVARYTASFTAPTSQFPTN